MNPRLRALLPGTLNKVFLPVAGILLFVLAWQLGRLMADSLGSSDPLQTPSPGLLAGSKVARPDPKLIARVFGETGEAGRATSLPVKLEGIMLAEPAEESRAFISERQAQAVVEAYRPGDLLPSGAVLKQVFSDYVILSYSGREETLRFDQPGQNAPAAPQDAAQAAGGRAPALASAPMDMLRQYGLRRTPDGYVVSVAAPRDMLKRFGFQPGDKLVKLNGQALGADVEADQQLIKELQQGGSAQVEIQRGEQTLTLEQKL